MIYCMGVFLFLGMSLCSISLLVYYHHVWLFIIVSSIGITALTKWSRKIYLLVVGLLIDLFSVLFHPFLRPFPISSIRFFSYPEKYQKTLTGRTFKLSKYVVFSSPIFPMFRFFELNRNVKTPCKSPDMNQKILLIRMFLIHWGWRKVRLILKNWAKKPGKS